MKLYLSTDNPLIYNYNDTTIEFVDVVELCQGCPEVGHLLINSVAFNQSFKFGTNVIFKDYWLILPQFIKSWKESGFKLCAIDLRTNQLNDISKIEPLTIPYKIEGDQTSKDAILP